MTTPAPSRLTGRLLPVLLASLLGACGGSDITLVEREPQPAPQPVPPPLAENTSGERLLITRPGDHDHLLVYDLESREAIASLHLEGRVSGLYASPSYRYGIAVQSAAGQVSFIDSGVTWQDHGDHGHLTISDPQRLPFTLSGTRPAHVTWHQDQTVIFFDGTEGAPAEVRIVNEQGLAQGSLSAAYSDDNSQHGVAQAWGEYLVVSHREPGASGPDAVKLLERHGDHFHLQQRFDQPELACPGLHGSAQNSGFMVFGCRDGVLLIEAHGDHFHGHKLPSEVRISSLAGHPASVAFAGIGRNSADEPPALFVINPVARSLQPLAYGKTPRAWAFADQGDVFVVLDTEGGLTAWDTHSWQPKGSRLQVAAAPEAEGETLRLSVQANGGTVYVADPGARQVLQVNVDHWQLESAKTIRLDFAPGAILWLGSDETEDDHHH